MAEGTYTSPGGSPAPSEGWDSGPSALVTPARRRLIAWAVWSVWLVMTTVALVFIALTTHNIPFHEDWSINR